MSLILKIHVTAEAVVASLILHWKEKNGKITLKVKASLGYVERPRFKNTTLPPSQNHHTHVCDYIHDFAFDCKYFET